MSGRLADLLARELDTDNDELLYQSARKLVIIEMQNIVYREFLPTLLGMTLLAFRKDRYEGNFSSFPYDFQVLSQLSGYQD